MKPKKRESWYNKGFREAREGLPADPPWYPDHRDYIAYVDGFRHGESQNLDDMEGDD